MLPKLGKAFCKAAWGKGGKGGKEEVSPGFKFQDKNFSRSNSSQLQEPLDSIGNPNPGFVYRTGAARQKNGIISGSAEEQDAVLVSAQDVLTGSLRETLIQTRPLFLPGRGGEENIRGSGFAAPF